MSNKKAKKYCIAYGCLNTNKTPNISFFTLPKEPVRRSQWLIAIDRLDLLNVENMKPTTYLVCSAHFHISSLNISTYREPKKDAVPNLVSFPIQERYVEKHTQTDLVIRDDITVTTAVFIKHEEAETDTVGTQTDFEVPVRKLPVTRKRKIPSPVINPLEPECSLVEGDDIRLPLDY